MRSPRPKPETAEPRSASTRFLDAVERLGNLLPHPVTLFALLCVVMLLMSALGGWLGWSVVDPRPEGAAGRSPDGTVEAISLLNAEGIRRILGDLVKNFVSFAPLGTVLVSLLGIGVAEKSGMLGAAVRLMILRAPKSLVTYAVVLGGVVSNTATELGYVVLIPLAGVVFYAVGRHPLAGIAAAFAGVSGGYSANLFVGTIDPLLAGITQEAARLISPEYVVHPLANWWFMASSALIITVAGVWVTHRIIEPKLGPYSDHNADKALLAETSLDPVSSTEKRGLMWAGISVLILLAIISLLSFPPGAVLRNPEDGDLLNSPLMNSIVALIFVLFVVPGIVYGKVTGSIKSDRDVIDGMSAAMSSMGLYLVLVFFASQFVAYFGWSNLGTITAVVGADALVSMNLEGPLLFTFFILMFAVLNLMIASSSGLWAVTAPVFVPMLMLTGYSPEVIQAAYRIGESTTNIITPMMAYFGLILAFSTRFDRKLGIGTMISLMLPYALVFLVVWIVWFYVYVFALQLPIGPGVPTYFVR